MAHWQTLDQTRWLDTLTELWTSSGAAALRARGQFTLAMDASRECLMLCRHLAEIDWPWSTTRILPARENWVPPDHARHCGSRIYKTLYPHKVNVQHWKTSHLDYLQSAELYARTLKKNCGDLPKLDLTLLAFSGDHSLAEITGNIPEYRLTSTYTTTDTHLPCLALTPWILKASRKVVGLSMGLNPPSTSLSAGCPLHGLLEQSAHPVLLHTR